MANKKTAFSVKKLFKEAWQIFKNKWQFIIGLGVLLFVIQIMISRVESIFESSIIFFLVMLVSWIVNIVIQMGFLKVYIKLADKKEVQISDLWSFTPKQVGNYTLGTAIYGVIVFLGMILLIVPGVYLMVKYIFAPYILVTQNVRPLKALEISAKMTAGQKLSILGLIVAALLINILGALALGLGLIITLPLTYLSYAVAYNTLKLNS